MESQGLQAKERVRLIPKSGYVCANISASESHPFWLPIARNVSVDEFKAVTMGPEWKQGYAALTLACQWGTPSSRERAANALGQSFESPYRRLSPVLPERLSA